MTAFRVAIGLYKPQHENALAVESDLTWNKLTLGPLTIQYSPLKIAECNGDVSTNDPDKIVLRGLRQ